MKEQAQLEEKREKYLDHFLIVFHRDIFTQTCIPAFPVFSNTLKKNSRF
jgi:hypothetical protein